MLHLGFDLVDAVKVKAALLAHGFGGRLRHEAGFGERFRGGKFNLQPGLKLVLVTPDAAHLRAGIACESRKLLANGGWE